MRGSQADPTAVFMIILGSLLALLFIYGYISELIEKKADEKARRKILELERELYSAFDNKVAVAKSELNEYSRKLSEKNVAILNKEKELEQREKACIDGISYFISEKTIGFPWVAEEYKKHLLRISNLTEDYLKTKKNPAIKAAEAVKDYSHRAAESEKNMLIYQGQLAYYEYLFPWIVDFKEAPDEIIIKSNSNGKNTVECDPAQKLLSSGEWESLSPSEKFQKALDRYWKRKKHNWEIGRDYERFIGYEYENNGCDVTYFGAIKGFEDLGRDLVVQKNNEIQIVQCKYWASEKTIHEKHIFQLFGTCIMYGIDNEKNEKQCKIVDKNCVLGVFVTSCTLSDTALIVAKNLNIKVIQNKKFEFFPCIKCNIGKDEQKIYHLPFDQMYDRIKIEKHKGEFYCATVAEAEEAGFRRAFRWHGNKP